MSKRKREKHTYRTPWTPFQRCDYWMELRDGIFEHLEPVMPGEPRS